MFEKKPKKKVLIVEDDALLSQILMEEFEATGFKIASVSDGLKAFEVTREFKPDVILLDLILPGIDGFAILKSLKSEEETKDIPVVVISNLSSISDIKSTKALGAEEYFIKSNVMLKKIIDFIKKL